MRPFCLLLLLPLLTIVGQQASISSQTPAGGFVRFAPAPSLSPGLQAFPQVSGESISPEIAQRINMALTRQDRKVLAAAKDCRDSFREEKHKSNPTAWQRTTQVTMAGPHYISLVATDSYYCGGPYPNDGLQLTLVYDLETGKPVNWSKLLPSGVKATLDTAADGSQVGVVAWPWLTRRAMAEAEKDCKAAFQEQEEVTFALWLDAARHTIMASPFSFPHVIAACAQPIAITEKQARSAGVAQELLTALATAKR